MSPPAATRLAEIDRDLDAASPTIRYRPLVRSIWRALLLVPAELSALAAKPECLSIFDRVAVTLVRRAVLGDAKAADMLANMIEGKPGLRHGDLGVRRSKGRNVAASADVHCAISRELRRASGDA